MNPISSGETNGGIQLPPIPEQATGTNPVEQVPGVLPEVAPAAFEQGAAAPQPAAPAFPSLPLPPLGQAPADDAVAPVSTPVNAPIPDVADDGDLIEKEWVNKAKKIIEDTRNDPHEQSKEITLFKADYMKKRYNKSIKLSE